jgi:hypothetical protein
MHAADVFEAVIKINDGIGRRRVLGCIRRLTGARRTRDKDDLARGVRQPPWRVLGADAFQCGLDTVAALAQRLQVLRRIRATIRDRSNVVTLSRDRDAPSSLARLAQVAIAPHDPIAQTPPRSTGQRALIGARLFRPTRAQRMCAMQRWRIRHENSLNPIGTFLADNYR